MATFLSPPEQRVVLREVAWETYRRLLDENRDCNSPRFTYERGVLEIMSPSAEHEWYNRLLSDLVKLLARELRIDILDLGSTTIKRDDVERGFEPDSCFTLPVPGGCGAKNELIWRWTHRQTSWWRSCSHSPL
jgi:Uma2 family endonuclease